MMIASMDGWGPSKPKKPNHRQTVKIHLFMNSIIACPSHHHWIALWPVIYFVLNRLAMHFLWIFLSGCPPGGTFLTIRQISHTHKLKLSIGGIHQKPKLFQDNQPISQSVPSDHYRRNAIITQTKLLLIIEKVTKKKHFAGGNSVKICA